MAHVGQKLALGAVGGFGRFLGMDQFGLGLFSRGDVRAGADEFNEALPVVIVEDRPAAVGPIEPRAVLAANPVFHVKSLAGFVRAGIGGLDPAAVLRMNAALPRLARARQLAFQVAEQLIDLPIPIDLTVVGPEHIEEVAGVERHQTVELLGPEERAFRPLAFGDFLLQLAGAFLDPFFQFITRLPQGRVALLNLLEHCVEPVNEQAQFVLALFDGAQRVVLFPGHRVRGPGQVQDRLGNDPLQARGNQKSHQAGADHNHDDNAGVAAHSRRQFLQVRLDVHRADGVVAEDHFAKDPQPAALQFDAVVTHRRRVKIFLPELTMVCAQHSAVGSVNAGGDDVRLAGQLGQSFVGRFRVGKLQRAGHVCGDNVRLRRKVAHHRLAKRHTVVKDNRHAGQRQGDAAGQQIDPNQLSLDGRVFKNSHRSASPASGCSRIIVAG